MNAELQDLSDHYDRISSMPDSILIHILTFLKAREAVQTCILSKRWIDLWAYLPSLKFDSEEFEDDVIFEQFVSFFLLFRKTSQLDNFELTWYPKKDKHSKWIVSWVVYAVRCKPHVIAIDAPTYYGLPNSIFCCMSLEELKLFLGFEKFLDDLIPRSINLPFLRKLWLASVNVNIEEVLLGCPLLEELELHVCSLVDIKISSPSLKYLTVVDCDGTDAIISCPNLINLHLVHTEVFDYTLRDLFSLKNAFLCIPFGGSSNLKILNSLSNLSNATKIELFGMGFESILAEALPNCLTFKNLRHLVLDKRLKYSNLDIMAYFLRCSPNLDKFYFSNIKEENISDDNYSTDSEDEDAYDDED